MTDETEVQAQETPATPQETEAKTEENAAVTPAEGEDRFEADDGASEEPEARKRPSGTQRLKARNERLLSELAERDRKIEELLKAREPKATEVGEPPKEEQFYGDFSAYERAMQDYTVRKAASEAAYDGVKKIMNESQAEERQRQAAEAEQELMDGYVERVADIKKDIPDFDDAMKAMSGVQVREDVTREIMASDKGPLIAYHLAKNPAVLRQLHAMTPMELAREMGRLEGSLRMPAQNKQTKAPPPAPKLAGGTAPAFDPNKPTSYADYKAWRFPKTA